ESFFFQAEDGIRDFHVTGVQTCALPISDFYVGELLAQQYNLVATPIVFQPTQAYFATPQGRHPEVLAAIDRHLSAWQANPGSFYYRTLDSWRMPRPQALLNRYGNWIIAGLGGLLV